jgi:hypothetical protein
LLVMSENSHYGHRISISVFDASLLGLLDQVGEAEKAKFKFGKDYGVHKIYISRRRFLSEPT